MTQTKKKLGKVSVDTFGPKANFFFSLLMTLVGLTGVFPFIFVIILSLTDENSIVRNGYRLIPDAWSTAGYEYLFTQSSTIVNAFMVTVFVTVVGTLINVTVTSTYASALSRPYFIFRRFFLFIILVTMLVGAGMVPSYIVMTSLLKLRNSIWALILPMALSPFNVIIMRTFFRKSIPESIIESAIGFWNDWFSALLYLDDQNLFPLQYVLMQIQANIDYIVKNAAQGASAVSGVSIPREATRMAMVVISTLPIALSYPFFQKYFISGLTIGGVKE